MFTDIYTQTQYKCTYTKTQKHIFSPCPEPEWPEVYVATLIQDVSHLNILRRVVNCKVIHQRETFGNNKVCRRKVMSSFPMQWTQRRHIWAGLFVLWVYLERRVDQLNLSKSQEHLCPYTAHSLWHLVAQSQNFRVKHVTMFTREKTTWKST